MEMSKEDTIPISLELAKVIQEQQQYIQDNLGEHLILFCARKPLMVSCKDRKERFIPKPDVMIAVCLSTLKD